MQECEWHIERLLPAHGLLITDEAGSSAVGKGGSLELSVSGTHNILIRNYNQYWSLI